MIDIEDLISKQESKPSIRDMADMADAISLILQSELQNEVTDELVELHNEAIDSLAEQLPDDVDKHFEGTVHDHDQSSHAGKTKTPMGMSSEFRENQLRYAVDNNLIAYDKEKGGFYLPKFGPKAGTEATGEGALAMFNRTRKMGYMGKDLVTNAFFDRKGDDGVEDPFAGLAGQAGEAMGEINITDLLNRGDSESSVADFRAVKEGDPKRDQIIDMVDAYMAKGLGAREATILATAYGSELSRLVDAKGSHEVEALMRLSEMAANHSKDESFQAKTAWVHDMIGLVGPDRVQGAFSAARGNFSSGGRISDDDIVNPAAVFAPARNHGTRIEALTDWLRNRRDSQGSLRAKLKLEDPSMGFIVEDGRGGNVVGAYRGNTQGNQFQPFSLFGAIKARDNHVVRGRDRGAFTNSDMFMSALFPPKTLTLTSATGTYQISFSDTFRDSFTNRMNFWKTWRGYTKKVDVEGDSGRALGVLRIMKEDFPGSFNVRTTEGRAIFDEGDYRDRRAQAGRLSRIIEDISREHGVGRRLTNEELFRRDPQFAAARQIKDAERAAVERSLGRSLTGKELSDWKHDVEQMEAVAQLNALMQQAPNVSARGGSSTGLESGVRTILGMQGTGTEIGLTGDEEGPTAQDLFRQEERELAESLQEDFGE